MIQLSFIQQAKSDEEIKRSLEHALDSGYKLIDTARAYGNERVIGQVLKERFSDGRLKREDIFITSKVMENYCPYERIFRKSMSWNQ